MARGLNQAPHTNYPRKALFMQWPCVIERQTASCPELRRPRFGIAPHLIAIRCSSSSDVLPNDHPRGTIVGFGVVPLAGERDSLRCPATNRHEC